MMLRRPTHGACAALLAVLLAACGPSAQAPAVPVEITRSTTCSLDGMTLADYPGPKAQMHYDQGPPDFFCDTMEMFSIYLRPEQQKRVRAVFVQDMGRTSWEKPEGAWIDARAAVYVIDGKLRGAMGPTFASFAREEDAKAFAAKHGGKVVRFAEVTPEMAQLDGGVLRDRHM